jgi:peroxiredoxin
MKRFLLYIGLGLLLLLFFWYRSRQPRFIAGEKAPDFQVMLADGKPFRLSDLRGRFVLLHFWGSWCGPCREENPQLVELYDQFNSTGFDIVSIGIERQEPAWQRAIAKDGMHWPHHSADFQEFDNPVAKQYNVHAIPTTFLINPEGAIMGVSLNPDQIHKILAEKLDHN